MKPFKTRSGEGDGGRIRGRSINQNQGWKEIPGLTNDQMDKARQSLLEL